jgi:hypothetical protein
MQVHHGWREVIHYVGAALAAFPPTRPEHEVVDDELAAVLEQIRQGYLAGRRLEDVRFVHLHPRQRPAARCQALAELGEFFIFAQQFAAGGEPFFRGDDGRIFE